MIKIGDIVRYRLYNSVEHKFYDSYKTGTVENIQIRKVHLDGAQVTTKMYQVTPTFMKSQPIWLLRKEVKKIINLEKLQKTAKELSEMEW